MAGTEAKVETATLLMAEYQTSAEVDYLDACLISSTTSG